MIGFFLYFEVIRPLIKTILEAFFKRKRTPEKKRKTFNELLDEKRKEREHSDRD